MTFYIPNSKSRPVTLSSSAPWEGLTDLPPHKIFLWDEGGHYIDYSFPNPLFGHCGNPTRLKGANVIDVLPGQLGQAVLEKIGYTLTSQKAGLLAIELPERNGQSFKAIIRLFPLARHVLGLVNDFPQLDLPTLDKDLLDTRPSPNFKSKHPLTFREQQIFQLVGHHLSNETIANELAISPRTVKYHLLNIYKKLGVLSRNHLQAVASCLLFSQSEAPIPALSGTSFS